MHKMTSVCGRSVMLLRDHIDTDQIIPARFLKVVDRNGLGTQLFNDWRYQQDGSDNPDFVLNDPSSKGAKILVAGENFGCGSSREHAPWALVEWGFSAVIARSFADIFRNNALKNGLIPVALSDEDHATVCTRLEANPALEMTVDVQACELRVEQLCFSFHIDAFAQHCLLSGMDQLDYILSFETKISEHEARTRTEKSA